MSNAAGGAFVGMLLGYVMSEAPTPPAPAVHVLTILANFAASAIELAWLDAHAHEAEERKQAAK